MPKKSTNPNSITLNIEETHDDFRKFYDNSKPVIFKTIIECFNILLTNPRKKKISLVVIGRISGYNWDTEFTFYKDDKQTLLRDVLPFFEQIEDYETCSEIINLHRELVK